MPALHAAVTQPTGVGRARPTWRWRERAGRARRLLTQTLPFGGSLLALLVALGLWAFSLHEMNPRAMTNLGLISIMPPLFVAALVILTGSFLLAVYRGPRRAWLIVLHLLALIVILRGTPEIVYGTLRYTWAFKHVGIVDYILRHHAVNPALTISSFDVYQDWPGFFAAAALLAKLAGLKTLIGVAGWAPVLNNVLYVSALVFVYSSLTQKRSVIWLSCWMFVIADWVGQDYFSPQGLAYVLYLLLIGVVLRWLRGSGGHALAGDVLQAPAAPAMSGVSGMSEGVSGSLSGASGSLSGTPGVLGRPGERVAVRHVPPGKTVAICLAVLLLAAITVTHALSAVMACIALAVLVLARVCKARWLVVIAAAMTAAWDLTFASHFAGSQFANTLASVRLPWQTTSSNLANFATLNPDQALVAQITRVLTVVMLALAVLGALRLWRRHRLDRGVVLLAVSPVLLFATGNYDGELLFRIFLFSVPFLSFLAVQAFAPSRALVRIPFATVALLGVLALFLVSYYGDDRANYVPQPEITAARWVDTHSPPHSLVVTANDCDVLWTEYYERFTCIPFGLQPQTGVARILAHPAAVLHTWTTNPRYPGASYIFLSTSQRVSAQENGGLPHGAIGAVQRALLASGRFAVVYRNRDAIVLAPTTVTRAGTRRLAHGPIRAVVKAR